MKRLISTMAAMAALLAGPLAHAQTWQFDNLAFAQVGPVYHTPTVALVSQSASETVVSFEALAATTRYPDGALDNIPGPRFGAYDGVEISPASYMEQYNITVRDGYRVTGVTLSATVSGILDPGQPNGETTNHFALGSYVGSQDVGGLQVDNLNGAQVIAGSTGAIELDGTFNFYLQTNSSMFALAAVHMNLFNGNWYLDVESYANIWVDNITATFQIAPVPEPETYLMLVTGLTLVGIIARRRRRVGAA